MPDVKPPAGFDGRVWIIGARTENKLIEDFIKPLITIAIVRDGDVSDRRSYELGERMLEVGAIR